MRSGGGSLDGKGWVLLGGPNRMSPRSAVFTAHAHRFLVAAAGSTGARIDGNLAVNAALREDVLTGKVEIPDANVWLPKGPPTGSGRDLQKVGAHADVHFVDQTALAAAERDRNKKREDAAKALRLAVKASAKPVYIRGKDLDIEVRSNIQIGTVESGPHAGAPTISGGIHIPRGRINIQGQRFDFEHGSVTFDGSHEINPVLDLKLTRQYPEALVVIELRGTPKKPQLRMSSDPAVYDQAQIVSLILTGQPGGQPSTGKSFDPTAAVATAVLSKLADKVAPALGLDVMRVEGHEVKNEQGEATGDTDTRVEVGKYVTERIYLSYAHIFGAPGNANQNEAHVEYRMTRRLHDGDRLRRRGTGWTGHPLDAPLLIARFAAVFSSSATDKKSTSSKSDRLSACCNRCRSRHPLVPPWSSSTIAAPSFWRWKALLGRSATIPSWPTTPRTGCGTPSPTRSPSSSRTFACPASTVWKCWPASGSGPRRERRQSFS